MHGPCYLQVWLKHQLWISATNSYSMTTDQTNQKPQLRSFFKMGIFRLFKEITPCNDYFYSKAHLKTVNYYSINQL